MDFCSDHSDTILALAKGRRKLLIDCSCKSTAAPDELQERLGK